MIRILFALLLAGVTATPVCAQSHAPFVIRGLDDQRGRGVPLVELQTTNHIAYYTDSNGIVAFDEPGLLGQRVYFHVRSDGYEVAPDGFGNNPVSLLLLDADAQPVPPARTASEVRAHPIVARK